jgi:hypothetical protein
LDNANPNGVRHDFRVERSSLMYVQERERERRKEEDLM